VIKERQRKVIRGMLRKYEGSEQEVKVSVLVEYQVTQLQ
jgi:hypothetical protein